MRLDKIPSRTVAHLLPTPIPPAPDARLLLFAIRRLGAHGVDDAHVAHAFIAAFGEGFRRPLILIRAFMQELAGTAQQPITIAPCCCQRMTPAESTLLNVITLSETDPERANLLLADLLGVRRADGVLTSAASIAGAFADAGRPILA